MPVNVKIQLRRSTAALWTSSNPVLAQGEVGLETDTGLTKTGDGINGWNALAYGPALPSVGPGPLGPIGSSTQIPLVTVDDAGRITALTAVDSASQPLVPTSIKTGNYAASAFDLVICDSTIGPFTVTLPPTPVDGTAVAAKMVVQASQNAITIATGNSNTFNTVGGAASVTLSLLNQGVILQYSETLAVWYVVSDDLPLGKVSTNLDIVTIGNGLQIAEGSNAKQGTVNLGGTGAASVSNTSVTANSRIFLTINTAGSVSPPGSPYVANRTSGSSFFVKSTVANDNSTIAYFITEPG